MGHGEFRAVRPSRRSHTLHEAIVAHGGEATAAAEQYEGLEAHDQLAVVTFLRTLKAPVIPNLPNPQELGSPIFMPPRFAP